MTRLTATAIITVFDTSTAALHRAARRAVTSTLSMTIIPNCLRNILTRVLSRHEYGLGQRPAGLMLMGTGGGVMAQGLAQAGP